MRFLLQHSAPAGVRRRCLPFGAACAVLLGLVAGCQRPAADSSGETDAQSGAAPEAPEVTAVKPARKTVRRRIERPGLNIEAYERTPLYAKIPGYVQTWNVDIGDHVKKDQVLAELYVPEMEVDVKEKQAAVDLALFSATLSVMVACLLRVECGTWPCPTPSMTRINPSPSRALSGMGVRGTRSVGKPARPFPVPTACGRVQR